jgi:hypothetical protein
VEHGRRQCFGRIPARDEASGDVTCTDGFDELRGRRRGASIGGFHADERV